MLYMLRFCWHIGGCAMRAMTWLQSMSGRVGVRSVLRPGSVLRGVPDLVLSRHKVVHSEVRSTEDSPGSALSGACSSVLSRMLSNCAKLVRSDMCSAGCAWWCTQQAKCFLAKFSGGCREG